MTLCKATDCKKPRAIKEYCSAHYQQVRKYGHVLKKTQLDSRPAIIEGGIAKIPLDKTGTKFALVDAGDAWLADRKWHVSNVYAASKHHGSYDKMHVLIMNPEKGMKVDHINGDTLDNRRSNLRVCTHAENIRNCKTYKNNKLGVKGVFVHQNRYRARIRFDNKVYELGIHDTIEAAAKAYERGAQRYHGEFARTA